MTRRSITRFKPRFLLVYPMAVWLFATAHTTERQLHLGIVVIALGLFVRLWANSHIGAVKVNAARGTAKIGRLVTTGPYAFVRHPLYFGTFVIGAGLFVIVGNPWLALVGLGFFLLVYGRKMQDEERLLRTECGAAYDAYERVVPRWLPTGRHYAAGHGAWSWRGIAASKEWKTVVWVAVTVIALYFREELVQEHEPLFGARWLKHLLILGVAVVLMALDGFFELRTRLTVRSLALASLAGAGQKR